MQKGQEMRKKQHEALLRDLKESYNLAVMKYMYHFLDKQGYEYIENWCGDVGDMAEIGDRYFNFRDIKYDIDTEQPAGRIIEWDDMCLEQQKFNINYESYCMGLRPKHIIESERRESLAKSKQSVAEAKEYLEKAIEDEVKYYTQSMDLKETKETLTKLSEKVNVAKKSRNKSKNSTKDKPVLS